MRAAVALVVVALLSAPGLAVADELANRAPSPDDDSSLPPSGLLRLGTYRSEAALADSSWRTGLFVGAPGGLGFNPTRTSAVEQGLRLTPSLLRDLPTTPRLAPPSEPTTGALTGAYVGYRLDNLLVSSTVRQEFTALGLGAPRFDLGASYGFNLTPRHLLTLSGGLTFGQTSALPPYYGAFGPDAASRWGYRISEPGAGFRLSWRYSMDRNLYLQTTLGYDRMTGDAPDGLQNLDRNTASFGTVFGYRW